MRGNRTPWAGDPCVALPQPCRPRATNTFHQGILTCAIPRPLLSRLHRKTAAWGNNVELSIRDFEPATPHTALSRISGFCSGVAGALGSAVGACGTAAEFVAARPARVFAGLVGAGAAVTSVILLAAPDLLDPDQAVERGPVQVALGSFGVAAGVATTAYAAFTA